MFGNDNAHAPGEDSGEMYDYGSEGGDDFERFLQGENVETDRTQDRKDVSN